MFGDVGQPQLVRLAGRELPTDEVVMGRRTDLGTLRGLALPEPRPPAHLRADAPHRPLTHPMAGVADLIGEEPVAELGIVTVRVEDRVREARVVELGVGDRTLDPLRPLGGNIGPDSPATAAIRQCNSPLDLARTGGYGTIERRAKRALHG